MSDSKLLENAINECNYEVIKFITKHGNVTYSAELLYNIIKCQDVCMLDAFENSSNIQLEEQLEDQLVKYYIMNGSSDSDTSDFIRHPYLDKLLVLRWINIESFSAKYISEIQKYDKWYGDINADIIYMITIYTSIYNDILFNRETIIKYCKLWNYKMMVLTFNTNYKYRLYTGYNDIESTMQFIINLITLITTNNKYTTDKRYKMSISVFQILGKELEEQMTISRYIRY